MILSVDHLVVPTTVEEAREISTRLQEAGFVRAATGDSPAYGTQNELLAFSGGAFLELAWEKSPGSTVYPIFSTTRVAGVGFLSNVLDHDCARWQDEEGAWLWERDWKSLEGEERHYRAAGPLPLGEQYLFIMEGSELPYDHLGATPQLKQIEFCGRDHNLWRERFTGWIPLPEGNDAMLAKDVEVRFTSGPQDGIEVSLTFSVERAASSIPLAKGAIKLEGPAM